jgi:demethylmenaquinone methyltransferase/2-methoxy-6-polyprenyl-1,4-benzoquinol methylase
MTVPTTSGARPGSGQMFDAIAPRYDLVNRVLSLGIDQRWRRRAVDALELPAGGHLLDLASGTGDLAIAAARRRPDIRVVGLDPSEGMLAIGRRKLERAGLAGRVELRTGDAQALPFDDHSFDGVSIAFGIRNVPDRSRALAEMARVTRPGGRVVVLELGEPRGRLMGTVARFHVHTVVPRLGALLSRAPEYRYLERSIAAFPPSEAFAAQMEQAGLSPVRCQGLTFGVANLFVARPAGGGEVR